MSCLDAQIAAVEESLPYGVRGTVVSLGGLTIEASDLALPVGSICRIASANGKFTTAEVIGFLHDRTLLMALDSTAGVARGDRVENITAAPSIGCCRQMLGRVLDGLGKPIDGKGPLPLADPRRLDAPAVASMRRELIDKPIATSIRCIDALLTCGLGQRMGIFSGPGVGKSVLLGQIAKHTGADVSVVGLIGERGREVGEFLHHSRSCACARPKSPAPWRNISAIRERTYCC
jgi:flagellum-specific ATP synthase